MIPFSAAQAATYELTPSSYRISPTLWTAFTALNKVHWIWRCYRKAELYTQPNNLAQLLAGHLANLVIGDSLMLRIAAHCVLISTRILECIQQQHKLRDSSEMLLLAIHGYYPSPYRPSWKHSHDFFWISPSFSGWLKLKQHHLWERMRRIVECSVIILLDCFKLSMHLIDVIDTFNLSPSHRYEGVNEFFINSMKCLDALVENKEELLKGIQANKHIIERIISNSPITYDQLHGAVSNALENTARVHSIAKTISDIGDGILLSFAKRMAGSFNILTGARNLYV